jgi:hypothetical protein
MAAIGIASASADPLWRLRWWLLASGISTLAALAVLDLDLSLSWHWSLFPWGIAVGMVGAGFINMALRAASLLSKLDLERRTRIRRRRLIYTWMWLFLGIETGMAAAMFDLVWIDVAVAAYVLVVAAAGLAILVVKKRQLS